MKTKTTRYDHMLDIAFTVISTESDPARLSPRELREGLLKRIAGLTDEDLGEAIGFCNTYENEKTLIIDEETGECHA